MSSIPSYKPRELIKKFGKLGYTIDRQQGSHVILYNTALVKRIVIPMHTKDLPKGTLLAIIKQSGLPKEEFTKKK